MEGDQSIIKYMTDVQLQKGLATVYTTCVQGQPFHIDSDELYNFRLARDEDPYRLALIQEADPPL
jgi:hypothetical protein